MRVCNRWVVWILFLLAATLSAQATTEVTMTLVGVGGAHQNGVYVAPYYFTVDSNPDWVSMMCDDFTHESNVSQTYTAVVSTIADLSQTRFFATYGLEAYEQAFWLYDQYLANPSEAGNINFAVWAIFDPSIIGNATYWNSAEQAWLDAAHNADLSNYDFSGFRVYTPIDPTSPQEMITKTPEPVSMLLLGSGLMTLAGLIRRRHKA